MDRLIKEFAGQICQAAGGPCKYTGRNMTEAHRNMGVTNGESARRSSRCIPSGRPPPRSGLPECASAVRT